MSLAALSPLDNASSLSPGCLVDLRQREVRRWESDVVGIVALTSYIVGLGNLLKYSL